MPTQDRIKDAEADLASLNRVSHRLAMVDTTEKLGQVLDKLLPRLLRRIGDNHQAQLKLSTSTEDVAFNNLLSKIHAKLVEMLSHTMKRVRDDKQCQIPCPSILQILLIVPDDNSSVHLVKANPKVDPFTMNLSLAFLSVGLTRCTVPNLEAMLPGLLVLHGFYSSSVDNLQSPSTKSQWHQITHLLFRTMELIMQAEEELFKNTPSSMRYDPSNKRLKANNSNVHTSTTATTAATTTTTATTTGTQTSSTPQMGSLEAARTLLVQDEIAAGAFYDFLLDIFLYQTVGGNVPPPGLSQSGHIRLKTGASDTARDWGAEMAQRCRLVQAKTRFLDWIAPSRRWALFLGKPPPPPQTGMDTKELAEIVENTNAEQRALTRLLALMITAAGDETPEVSSRALTYLKQYFDSQREIQPFGDFMALMKELLVLCVGANNAQIALANPNLSTLGLSHSSSNQPALLSFKRRLVSDTTFATFANYVSKVLEEVPQVGARERLVELTQVGTLAVLACTKTLSRLRTSAGLTLLRGKPFVAAAQLLNTLVVRISAIEDDGAVDSIAILMARSMEVACSSLSSIGSSNGVGNSSNIGNSRGSEGNTAVRDALYGVICVLSRSKLPLEKMAWLFSLGNMSAGSGSDGTNSLSVDTATLLFGCILGEEENLRPRVVAALDALLASYCRLCLSDDKSAKSEENEVVAAPVADNPWGQVSAATPVPESSDKSVSIVQTELSKLLLPLLWNASRHTQPRQSRVAAARWSSDLLSSLDCTSACHILCFLAGDTDVTAASIAKDGLGLLDDKVTPDTSNTHKSTAEFAQLVGVLFADSVSSGGSSWWRPNYWEFTPNGRAIAVQYLIKCLLNDIYGGDDDAMLTFVQAISKSIVDSASSGKEYLGLLDECAGALSFCLSASSFARSLVATKGATFTLDEISDLAIESNSSKARRLLAESWGHVLMDIMLWENVDWVQAVEKTLRRCLEIMEGSSSVGPKHGAAFLGAACIRAFRHHSALNAPESLLDLASSVLTHMAPQVLHADDTIGNAFADGLTIALAYDTDDAPLLNEALLSGATIALLQLGEALRQFGNGDNIDVPRVSKLAKAAGSCLAATTIVAGHEGTENGTGGDLGSARLSCVDSLFLMLGSAAFRKDEEVALWTGEALALYSDAFSPKEVNWSSQTDEWPAEMNDDFAKVLPPHQQVVYLLLRKAKFESSPQKRTAVAPALFAVVARAAKRVNVDSTYSHRCLPQELCKRLGEIQTTFLTLLADPKSKHMSRESCCLGLAACRSLSDIQSTNNEDITITLLRAFGQTTNYGGSVMQETPEQAAERRRAEGNTELGANNDAMDVEPEVGGAAGIGEASLGAYREMAGAAVSIGRPDILYALLMLSVSNPAWLAEGRDYGPSALLGQHSFLGNRGNAAEMRKALKSHLGKLIPRILRGCYSPNKETREQMQNLWNGITGGGAEAREAISEHLLLTIDTLIEDTTSKLWRTRLGACGALAQVIVGRSWRELGGGPAVLFDDEVLARTTSEGTSAGVRLLRLWRVAIRSLDDVRGNVREAGETLGRGVKSLTLRLVDPKALISEQETSWSSVEHEKDASAAAATALRWLIKHGLNQQCAAAAGVCISCLVGIVDVANPQILQPLVPDLLRSLLLSMSSLEPAAFSYLQVRAAGQDRDSGTSYDTLERLRLQVVQSGPLATAVTKCLEMMPHMDIKSQKSVVPELDAAIRQSAGLTTRTAAADCVSTLCSTCPNAFRNNGPSQTNPSVSLLRALYSASERERGQAARDKYAHACGNLAALCPGASVRSLALRASEKYNSSTGSNDDPAARKAAAITLRAIAVKASNQFSDGGNADIWCRRVLPVAFLGMRDPDPKVAALFSDVWEEGGSAANLAGAADGFGTLLEEKLIFHLCKECEKALKDVSWSRRVIGAVALKELALKEVLSPAPRRLIGGARDSSLEQTVRAQRRAQASNRALVALVKVIAETRLWSGKQNVVEACCTMASKWSSALANIEDPREVLGSTENSCTWSPVSLETDTNSDDLFLNDGWFKKVDAEDFPEEESQVAKDKMEVDDGKEVEEAKQDENDEVLDQDDSAESPEVVITTVSDQDTSKTTSVPTYVGLCRMLLVQAFPSNRSVLSVTTEEVLPYRAAVLKALSGLLESIDASVHGSHQKKLAFTYVASTLAPLFVGNKDTESKEESPLIVSRALDCFASSFWEDFGTGNEMGAMYSNILELSKIFQSCAAPERPWTIKHSSLNACARLAMLSSSIAVRDQATISIWVECASAALKDRKFWKVRHAGLLLLQALVDRAGKAQGGSLVDPRQSINSQEQQLVLEALLPQKETIVKLAKKMLSDPEAKVTASASDILRAVTWWP